MQIIQHQARLTRKDMLLFEARIRSLFQQLIPFEGYAIRFPKNNVQKPIWAAEEEVVYLPLYDTGYRLLGVVVLHKITEDAPKIIDQWHLLMPLIVDNLLLYKQSMCDPVTGLYARHYLLHRIERGIHHIMSCDASGSFILEQGEDSPLKASNALEPIEKFIGCGSLGVIVIRFEALRHIVKEYGHKLADELLMELAAAIQKECDEMELPARIGDLEFAIFCGGGTAKKCCSLAERLISKIEGVFVEQRGQQKKVWMSAATGYALYPQDTVGSAVLLSSLDQARLILRKARLAAALASESSGVSNKKTLAFRDILINGGRICGEFAVSRVMTTLGTNAHAREGQRFSVWGSGASGAVYKGEILLIDVQETSSFAEVVHVGDPSINFAVGDRLHLLIDEQKQSPINIQLEDTATRLLSHSGFMAQWAEARETQDEFSMALLQFFFTDSSEEGELQDRASLLLGRIGQLVVNSFGEQAIIGRYGVTSCVMYHRNASLSQEELKKMYGAIVEAARASERVTVAVGIATYPYLDFRKAETLENCRKALDYALLLPEPHIGLIDSLALNIRADKLFSQNDVFGAIKEYQRAVLADKQNSLARNSLGICFAGLQQLAEAEEQFLQVLQYDQQNTMSLYNLGYVYQMQKQADLAIDSYERCLQIDSEHLFAHIRLGQLSEMRGDLTEARKFYEKVASLSKGKGTVCRHLARLCTLEGNYGEARELLHEALLHDPQDALALMLLARLFLDAGEDAELAASLARQSVALCPGLRAGWLELARAMELSGDLDKAREAKLQAASC